MKKKLLKHIDEIATGEKSFVCSDDERIYFADSSRIIMTKVFDFDLSKYKRQDGSLKMCKDWMAVFNDERNYDYQIHELPSVTYFKEIIKNLVGNKRKRVVWSDGKVTINARYLMKAMEALSVNICYVATKTDGKLGNNTPIYLLDEDDLVAEMILPCYNNTDTVGLWIVD